MGGFTNNSGSNIEFNSKNFEVSKNVTSNTASFVYSNSASGSHSDVEVVDLDDDQVLDDGSNGGSNDKVPEVKVEETTDFSQKEYDNSIIDEYLKNYGDANGDGKVDVKDISVMQNALIGKDTLKDGVGDVDGDGRFSIKDVNLIQNYISGKKFVVSNINIANRLDKIKYQKEKDKTDAEIDELYDKYYEMDFSVKFYEMKKKLHSSPTYNNNNNTSSHYGGWHDGYVGGKRKKSKDSSKSGDPQFPAHEAGQKKKFFYERYKSQKADAKTEAAAIKEYGSLKKARDAYEEKIDALKYKQKLLEEKLKLAPYENMMSTAEFKKWANKKDFDSFDPTKNSKLNGISKYVDSYKYMDASQIAIYNYLLDTEGEDEANKLIDILQDNINKAKGYEKAQQFIKKMDVNFKKIIKEDGSLMDNSDVKKLEELVEQGKYDKKYDMNDDGKLDSTDVDKLGQYIETGGEIETTFKNMQISFNGGFADGWKKFFDGIGYLFNDDGVLSDDEYKMMYIGQMLQQNGVIEGSYEFGNTVGNMMPVIIASAIATVATAPFGGEGGEAVFTIGTTAVSAAQIGKCTAATLIFASTFGNSKHEALCNGHSLASAIGYGVLCGLSEAGLETALGSIPFVGQESRSLLVSMFREGLSESMQELASSVIGFYTLGEEIDVSELSANMGKAFVMGAMLSGAGNIGKGVANMKVVVDGVRYELNGAQILQYYRASVDPDTGKSNGLTLKEFILENIEDAKTKQNLINKMGTPTEVVEKFKSNKFTVREIIDYVDNSLTLGIITDEQVHEMFTNLVGEDLASWSPSNEVSTRLFKNMLVACDKANISAEQLTKNMKLLDMMKGYYEDAKNIQEYLQSGKGTFETYRTHGIIHIMDVFTKSIEACNAFEDAGIQGMDVDAVMLAAIMHDTGMSGGKQLKLSVDSNGKLKIAAVDIQMDGDSIRESHSYNSGVNVIENYDALKSLGYSDAQIAEAALLAFAHSKSNSGLNPLSSNPAGWSFAIQALQASSSGKFDFVGALKDAGIIKDVETKGTATVTVKSPKYYKTNAKGQLIDANGKVVGTEGAGKPVLSDDYNPNSDKNFKGDVGLYEFGDGVLDRLAYEALAVRIGDALTNNDNGKINQFGGEVVINDSITHYENQSSVSDVLAKMQANGKISSATVDTIVEKLLAEKDGLRDAAFAETRTPLYNEDGSVVKDKNGNIVYDNDKSVVFGLKDEDGKTTIMNKSQPFVLGENNQTYSVSGNKDGVEVAISVKDSSAFPFCTLFAIEERAGELTSKGKNLMTASARDGTTLTMVIEIDKNTPEETKAIYQQYVDSYAKNDRIKVKLRYK